MTTGHRKLLEQLAADGHTVLFGNPGTSEEGLLDEIARFPAIRYVLGLQEAALVCIADGYAQATQKPAVVLLHAGVGLGNAIGSLYHARRRRTPLLILVGESGARYDPLEAHMWADLVGMARPVAKYAARASHPESVVRLVRRCLKIAASPPFGPVVLTVPQDVLDAENNEPVVPTLVPSTRVAPEPALVAEAVALLRDAENPLILMGDGVSHSGGQAELTRLAEVLAARVYGVMVSELVMPWTHPLYCGMTGHMFGETSERIVRDADAVLVCGTYLWPEVFPLLGNSFRPDARIVHVDLDGYEIAKNHPVTLGLVSDPKLTLKALADGLGDRMTADEKAAARARYERIGEENRQRVERAKEADLQREGVARDALQEAQRVWDAMRESMAQDMPERPVASLRMSQFARALAEVLPEDAVIFDESLTHFPDLMRYIPPTRPGHFFQTPGGTLGVGLPGAIGAKLAHPDKTVIGFTGDGGAMYTYQALWTAVHDGIGAKFVVCNNSSYRLLKQNILDYWQDMYGTPDKYPPDYPPSFDLSPSPDFVGLARALGVPGRHVRGPDEVAEAVREMLAHDGPYLLELDLNAERDVPRPAVERAAADKAHATTRKTA